jgi:DNA (cytosine-5)-methyltransferase 1
MTFGSLFAGIGGFDLGLERAGMECRWQVERNPYAASVLEKHWPNVTRWREVETFPPDTGCDWKVDLICAGVPCQPISQAGKRKGTSDERWMWGECLRVVADLCPRFFVAENPVNILNDDSGRTFAGIVRAIASLGYVCEWHVIRASDVGARHRRARVWIVAYSDELRREGGDASATLQGVEKTRHEPAGSGQSRGCRRHPVAAATRLGDCIRRQREAASGLRGLPGAARIHWASEPSVGRVAHGVPNRVDRLRCLGNAIVPQVAEVIGRAIVEFESASFFCDSEGSHR